MNRKFRVQVVNGKIRCSDAHSLRRQEFLAMNEGKFYDEVFNVPQHPKTLQQIKYFHGVLCKLIAEGKGFLPTDSNITSIKEHLKRKLLSVYSIDPITNEIITVVPSLGSEFMNNQKKFSTFIDYCIDYAIMELEVDIPPIETVDIEGNDNEFEL